MNVKLPDISQSEDAPHLASLEWVGMQGIDVPVLLVEGGYQRELHAKADLQVDIPIPHIKGIHMSRLYRLLDSGLGGGEILSPNSLRKLLSGMIDTHEDCNSKNARIRLGFDLLMRRPALITDGLAGWKSYPVELTASVIDDQFKIEVEVSVEYSSTCPCSAALSRQLIEQGFVKEFEGNASVAIEEIAAWLRESATLATPHSQRSEARVSINLSETSSEHLGLIVLIDRIENAVATPVQTAVKRADEQAFAALNGQNLMFVEDAARRIGITLADFSNPKVFVRHKESLHPHDAVAWSSPSREEN